MFKLLSYKFLVCLDSPGKANLHNLPLFFFLGKVLVAFVMLGDLEDKVSTPQQLANGCVLRGMGENQRGKLNGLCVVKR